MPDKHAFLSASSSHRWINCPPSAALCAKEPNKSSPYAQQGTDAHSLCEHKVLTALGQASQDPTESLTWFDEEMADCTDQYCTYVMEQLQEAKKLCGDPQVLVEQRLDFSRWVPDAFGTGDCLIVADQILHIIDFKYGLGILVEAENNPQMMCYALGALDTYDGIYDIKAVRMTIFQPRRSNISTFTMKKEDLLDWKGTSVPAHTASSVQSRPPAGNVQNTTLNSPDTTSRCRSIWNLQKSLLSCPALTNWSPGQATSRTMPCSPHSAARTTPATKSWKADPPGNTRMRTPLHLP